MVISPLRRKVLRDLLRLWAQVLAISLVLAAGVATMILGNGAYASLSETRARYYEANRFADVFADVTRAPNALMAEIEAIDGVLAAEARILKLGLLDMPGMAEPGSVMLVSLPLTADTGLNRLHLRQGRLPDPQSVERGRRLGRFRQGPPTASGRSAGPLDEWSAANPDRHRRSRCRPSSSMRWVPAR